MGVVEDGHKAIHGERKIEALCSCCVGGWAKKMDMQDRQLLLVFEYLHREKMARRGRPAEVKRELWCPYRLRWSCRSVLQGLIL